mgnify:FL=1
MQPPPQTNQSGNSPVNEETLLTPQNQKILVKQNAAKKTLSGTPLPQQQMQQTQQQVRVFF